MTSATTDDTKVTTLLQSIVLVVMHVTELRIMSATGPTKIERLSPKHQQKFGNMRRPGGNLPAEIEPI